MGRRLPAAAGGRLRQSAKAAAAIPDGQVKKPRVPVDQLRALGLRPNWERVSEFPPMEEDKRYVGLLAVVRKEITKRAMHCYHTGVAVGSDRGYPDLTIWGPRGVIFRELKGTKGELYVIQHEIIQSLNAVGTGFVDPARAIPIAAVWWPEDYHIGLIAHELDWLAGVPDRERAPVLRPGYRRCGCHMDADHTCLTWGGYSTVLPTS